MMVDGEPAVPLMTTLTVLRVEAAPTSAVAVTDDDTILNVIELDVPDCTSAKYPPVRDAVEDVSSCHVLVEVPTVHRDNVEAMTCEDDSRVIDPVSPASWRNTSLDPVNVDVTAVIV